MAKKRETRKKVKTLAPKKLRPADAKKVKGGFIWFETAPQTEAPTERLFVPSNTQQKV